MIPIHRFGYFQVPFANPANVNGCYLMSSVSRRGNRSSRGIQIGAQLVTFPG